MPKSLPRRLGGHSPRQGDGKCLLFLGLQGDVPGHAVLDAVRTGVVDPAGDIDRLRPQVLHVDGQVLAGRQVPVSAGGLQRDARPGLLVPGGDLKPSPAQGKLGVVDFDEGQVRVLAKGEQDLVGGRAPLCPKEWKH